MRYPSSAPLLEPKYFLREHAYICRVRRHWIILDVCRDRYLCIPSEQFASIGPLIRGWSTATGDSPSLSQHLREEGETYAAQLIAKGVLSEDSKYARELPLSPIAPPTSILDTDDLGVPLTLRMLCIPSFFVACATAAQRFRLHTFESTVAVVKERRDRVNGAAGSFDFQRARILVSVFKVLRLWYPRSYLCLFDSLALLEFLALHGLYPRWTFGVTADPFLAHCWLQEGSIALGDSLARVSAYTPIMSV
jgi:Transglutaminase-like superfamily